MDIDGIDVRDGFDRTVVNSADPQHGVGADLNLLPCLKRFVRAVRSVLKMFSLLPTAHLLFSVRTGHSTCIRTLAAHAQKSGLTSSGPHAAAAQHCKTLGNAAFTAQRYTDAIEQYSLAIEEPVHAADVAGESERRSVYLLNRAQAYLRRAQTADDTCTEVPDKCVSSCLSNLFTALPRRSASKTA